jgi:catechol 2,3-dioxygenase-like lactoylglutathione lyase family enzyme
MPMTRAATTAISPSFIVSNVDETIAFYRDKLGFETRFREPDQNPFFAIIGRDGAQIFVKSQFAEHGAAFSAPLKDTHDGLRGFEISDPDGYVLFFGRPR